MIKVKWSSKNLNSYIATGFVTYGALTHQESQMKAMSMKKQQNLKLVKKNTWTGEMNSGWKE